MGTRYFYRVGDGPPRPDPASRYQPSGVHGPSEVVSRRFSWTDQRWRGVPTEELLIYEIHVGTFTERGTFLAAIDRLDELIDLGVTAVELMPVADSAGRWNWGYDGVNLFAPRRTYGTPDELRQFVDAAHAKGFGGDPRRRLQPLRTGRQLPRRIRVVLVGQAQHGVGRRAELRRRGSRARAAAIHHRQRDSLVRRIPLRRTPDRRDPLHDGRPRPPRCPGDLAGHARLVGADWPPRHADRRIEHLRPGTARAAGTGRLRVRRRMVRRFPAQRLHHTKTRRTADRSPLRRRRRSHADLAIGVCLHRHAAGIETTETPPRARRHARFDLLHPEPRLYRQPSARRAASPADVP